MNEGVKLKKFLMNLIITRKTVVNIFIHRGVQVYKTVGYTISYLIGERKGRNTISELFLMKMLKIGRK